MKLHVYGNIANNGYNVTRFLRATGVDATLFLDGLSGEGGDMPWWEDADLGPEKLPSWIRYYPIRSGFVRPDAAAQKMIQDFGACDVALVCGYGPILAARAGVPFVFYTIGQDLNCIDVSAELKALLHSRAPVRSLPRTAARYILYGRAQRAALEKADRILVLMGYQVRPFIEKFGLAAKTSKARLPWDTTRYAVPVDEALHARYKEYDLLFFMIARHTWRSVWRDIKGNDKFIRAYARFVKATRPSARLVMVERGPDVEASKRLVAELGITDHVEWAKSMNKDGIRSFESLPNCVVVDQFWHDEWYRKYPEDKVRAIFGFGSGSIEALSAGRPLITIFTDEAFYEGAVPPILTAFSEDEIFARLVEVQRMTPEARQAMGDAGREFAYRWHDWRNVIPIYVDALTDVLEKRRGHVGVARASAGGPA